MIPHLPSARAPRKTWRLRLGQLFVIGLVVGCTTPLWLHAQRLYYWYWLGSMGAVLGALIVAEAVWQGAFARFKTTNARGLELLMRGQLDDAEQVFAALADGSRFVMLRDWAEQNRAFVELLQGRLDAAVARLAGVDGRGRVPSTVYRCVAINMSVAYALAGDATAAQAWLETADKRPEPDMPPRNVPLARALIGCRRGQFADVARELETRWHELEQKQQGHYLRPLRLVRAFAVARSPSREAEQAAMILQPLGPGAKQELAWLGAAWPELQAFIATQLG